MANIQAQTPPYESVQSPLMHSVAIKRKPIARKPLPGADIAKTPFDDVNSLKHTNTREAETIAARAQNLATTHPAQDDSSRLDQHGTPVPSKRVLPLRNQPPLAVDTGAVPSGVSLELVESPSETILSAATTQTPTSATSTTSSSKWKSMYEEARHFAGGLVSRPVESTKHYSVMRHSYGIVYYQGAATSIAITVFSDQPLPAERTFWLQCRGWSGKTGLRIGTLVKGAGNWIDVTPSSKVTPDQLVPSDERAWQRDVSRFNKKVKKGPMATHVVRETDIIRIPAGTQDGYFRIMLCGPKKKVLCPSPIFRVSSMSSSPSTLRGASLSTLPLEIGGKIVSSLVSSGMNTAAQPIKASVKQWAPGVVARDAAEGAAVGAYSASGVQRHLDNANQAYAQDRQAEYEFPKANVSIQIPNTVQAPYPLSWTSRIIPSPTTSGEGLEASRIDIDGVSEKILFRLWGHYFAWARLCASEQTSISKERCTWCHAIVSVVPDVESRASVKSGMKRHSFVYLVRDFFQDGNDSDGDDIIEKDSFAGASIDLRVMGFLRPPGIPHAPPTALDSPVDDDEIAAVALLDDIALAIRALDRPGWGPEDSTASPIQAAEKHGVKGHYVAARQATQDRVDNLKLHRYGVRTEKDVLMDKIVGTGGYYVLR